MCNCFQELERLDELLLAFEESLTELVDEVRKIRRHFEAKLQKLRHFMVNQIICKYINSKHVYIVVHAYIYTCNYVNVCMCEYRCIRRVHCLCKVLYIYKVLMYIYRVTYAYISYLHIYNICKYIYIYTHTLHIHTYIYIITHRPAVPPRGLSCPQFFRVCLGFV